MIIGLTGGIGSGKSTVLKILEEKYDFTVFEADKIAHDVMSQGEKAYDKIVAAFGEGILDDNGNIDRKSFGNMVFNDRDKLNRLNRIVHPAVIENIEDIIADLSLQGKNNFVIEAALLIESGCDKICDRVWYVYANEEARISRLKSGRGMTAEQIDSVIQNQLKREEFEKMTDAVIDNSFSIENTKKQIQNLLEF